MVDGSKRCAYHSGVVGHDNEDFYGCKNKIEALIKDEEIQLAGPQPNVSSNPLQTMGMLMTRSQNYEDSPAVGMQIEMLEITRTAKTEHLNLHCETM
ncbi:hypothetical protein CQW23_28722 [Capsicum baccatum]|uniref:Uncharacterized protein n=1 Tax=Capsicum baccatum TaxID=33114 RepID=A0A2G2VHB8_CAPBA|nr:hypothetical protein CQW23_28722 [Capsicum baccatum]